MAERPGFCPYVGLQPFTEEDRAYFFGREREIRVVCANLYAAKLTTLYGASGVGKSSLLMAGVMPELRRKPRTAVVMFREWQRPEAPSVLKAAVARAADEAAGKPLGLDATLPLDELLAAAGRAIGTTLLLLDQFEEYFRYPHGSIGDAFEAEFARAVNRRDVDAGFMLSIREDSLSMLDRFRARIPTVLANPLRIRHLRPQDARDAILKPLDVYNRRPESAGEPVTIEPALVDALIEQTTARADKAAAGQRAEDERVEAPYLQLVLERLWDQEAGSGSRVLRAETLQRLGGAESIVDTHLDQVMSGLSAADQALCAEFFDRLVTPSGAKMACKLDDFRQWAGPQRAPNVERVLAALTGNARILRAIDPQPGQPPQYEIFHDVLAASVLKWCSGYGERRKLDEARAEADRQRKEAEWEQERRTARKLRMLTGWLAMAGVAAICFALAATWLWWVAEGARADARARHLAAESSQLLELDPDLAQLLAVEAHRSRPFYGSSPLPTADAAARVAYARFVQQKAVLRGHATGLATVAFSPDGKLVLTGGADGTARLWSSDGRLVATLKGHKDRVTGAAFSPDGKRVVTASWDHTARVWDLTGREVATPMVHGGGLTAVAVSPDGKLVLTASDDLSVRLWNLDGAAVTEPLTGHEGKLTDAAFSPDGTLLVTASWDKTARVWDISGKNVATLKGHRDAVNSAAFSPVQRLVVTASNDGTARVWDISGKNVATLKGHRDAVSSAAFSPDGKLVVTAGYDDTARLWDLVSREVKVLAGHVEALTGVAFSPDGRLVVTASYDKTARLWDLAGNEVAVLKGHGGELTGVALSPDGKLAVTASNDGTARLWTLDGERAAGPLKVGPVGESTGIAVSRDGKLVIAASDDGAARVWDQTGKEVATLPGHEKVVRSVAFSPDGKLVGTASDDGTARVWDLAGKEVAVLKGHSRELNGIAFSPDGKLVGTASNDMTARIWDLAGKEVAALMGHEAAVREVAFSPDGKLVGTASNDGTARVWDLAGREVVALKGHARELSGVAFSPDGRSVVTASHDKSARLWNLSGKEVARPMVHASVVTSAAFSPDGNLVATVSDDGVVRLWKPGAKVVQEIDAQEGEVRSAAFISNGKLVTVNGDGTVRSWPCDVCGPTDDKVEQMARRVGRGLTDEERETYGLR